MSRAIIFPALIVVIGILAHMLFDSTGKDHTLASNTVGLEILVEGRDPKIESVTPSIGLASMTDWVVHHKHRCGTWAGWALECNLDGPKSGILAQRFFARCDTASPDIFLRLRWKNPWLRPTLRANYTRLGERASC